MHEGDDATIIATGEMVYAAVIGAQLLKSKVLIVES